MSVEVRLPQWGMAMLDAEVVRWLKRVGDRVEEGEPIVEVEAAKVSGSVEAPASGTLAKIVVAEGGTAEVAQLLAVIEPA